MSCPHRLVVLCVRKGLRWFSEAGTAALSSAAGRVCGGFRKLGPRPRRVWVSECVALATRRPRRPEWTGV
eukprot:15483281-Alexandrium_andersonii.AAC.1